MDGKHMIVTLRVPSEGQLETAWMGVNWTTRYPYPIFDVLSTWQRVLLFAFSALLMTTSTVALKWLYGRLNGIEEFQKTAVRNPAGLQTKDE